MTNRPLPDLDETELIWLNLALSFGVPIYYDFAPEITRYSLLFQPIESIRHIRGPMDMAPEQILVSLVNFNTCYTFDILNGDYFHPTYVKEKLLGTSEYDAECLAHLLNGIRNVSR